MSGTEMKSAIGMKNPKGWGFTKIKGKGSIKTLTGEIISGEVIYLDLDRFVFGNPKVFEAQYGTHNGIWDQIVIRENGGSMLVPFAVNPNGELFVAGGYEVRPLYHGGETLFTPPGGWKKDVSEKPEQTAINKSLEESDLAVTDPIKIGEVINNRAINLKNEEDPWPTTFFAMRIPWEDLIPSTAMSFCLREGIQKTSYEVGKLTTLEFINVYNAISFSNDALAVAAYAKLLAAYALQSPSLNT